MRRITISIGLLLAVGSVIWILVANWKKNGAGITPSLTEQVVESQPVVRDGSSQPGEIRAGDEAEMLAFERRIGWEFTNDEKDLKPPEVGWTAWGQFVDVHRMQSFKNGPIEFYGLVVTPNGEPVSGLSIMADVDFYVETIREKLVKGKTMGKKSIATFTDETGRFSIQAEKGARLTLSGFSKDGFRISGKKKGWAFSFIPTIPDCHKPDLTNPVIFMMEKVE